MGEGKISWLSVHIHLQKYTYILYILTCAESDDDFNPQSSMWVYLLNTSCQNCVKNKLASSTQSAGTFFRELFLPFYASAPACNRICLP